MKLSPCNNIDVPLPAVIIVLLLLKELTFAVLVMRMAPLLPLPWITPVFVIIMDVPAMVRPVPVAGLMLAPSAMEAVPVRVYGPQFSSPLVSVNDANVPDPGHAALASPDAASSISTATGNKTAFFLFIKRRSTYAG
jgi:hypothetical protein